MVGFKPTYGRVSRYELIAFASSLDQIGPFTRTVEDCALVYSAIAGHDPRDSTSDPRAVDDPLASLHAGVAGMRLGIPREYLAAGLEPGVRAAVETAFRVLEAQGATLHEVSLPSTDVALSVYYIIAPAECSSNLARYDGCARQPRRTADGHRDVHADARSRFRPRGQAADHARYVCAVERLLRRVLPPGQKVRTLVSEEFEVVFEEVGAIVCPTSPSVAFPMGSHDDPLSMYMCDVVTLPANLAGVPGISVPCGFVDGLPVGLQVIAPRFEDSRVLRVAHAV